MPHNDCISKALIAGVLDAEEARWRRYADEGWTRCRDVMAVIATLRASLLGTTEERTMADEVWTAVYPVPPIERLPADELPEVPASLLGTTEEAHDG